MAITYNGTKIYSIKYNGTTVQKVIMNGETIFCASCTTSNSSCGSECSISSSTSGLPTKPCGARVCSGDASNSVSIN